MRSSWQSAYVLGLLAFACGVRAIGQSSCVTFTSSGSVFPVVSGGKATQILISPDEWPGVQEAASVFAADIQRVTGVHPSLTNVTTSSPSSLAKSSNQAIIIGTLGKSTLIDQIVNTTRLDVSGVQGQWESFVAKEVSNPLPGISSAYVIIGADKRGSIFGLYDHSEQFGKLCCLRLQCSCSKLTYSMNRCLSLVLVRIRVSCVTLSIY